MRRPRWLGLGYAVGGADPGSRRGPGRSLAPQAIHRHLSWSTQEQTVPACFATLRADFWQIRRQLALWRAGHALPVVIGGDHSVAIATWQGVANRGPIGLLWIDAHLDAHTPASSHSKRLHGMPLAALLGLSRQGFGGLVSRRAVDPKYCTVIGVRSFEPEERRHLESLGVTVIDDATWRRDRRGILRRAWQRVARCPNGVGISLDLDVLDPRYSRGTAVPVPGGPNPRDLAEALARLPGRHRLLAIEITEYTPGRDRRHRTKAALAMLIKGLLSAR